MKVIIAGSRDFADYGLLKAYCDLLLSKQNDVEIVSGGAKGADTLGERYAKEKGYKLTIFEANWISVKDRLPEVHQSVAFVVDSINENYNNVVLGGKYQGFNYGFHEFTCPGISFKGKYWMPLPEPPIVDKHT